MLTRDDLMGHLADIQKERSAALENVQRCDGALHLLHQQIGLIDKRQFDAELAAKAEPEPEKQP